jgi:hypothetical protein
MPGTYYGEVEKGTERPSGRGVLKTDDGKIILRNFEHGENAAGSSIYVD